MDKARYAKQWISENSTFVSREENLEINLRNNILEQNIPR